MTNSNTQATRVLIADDDLVIRQVLRSIVEGAGMFVVGEASDGKAALDLFAMEVPEIVCLDIEMPEMKGLDVLTKIRQQSPSTVVLLISAFTTTQNVLGAVRLQADGIIGKPFTREKVLGEIARAQAKIRASQQRLAT